MCWATELRAIKGNTSIGKANIIDNIEIRTCQESDIELLEKVFPSGTNNGWHLQRFKSQQKGDSTYLVAFLNGQPVGHLDLLWKPVGNEVRNKYLKDQPEINALVVVSELQSQGIGSKLIHVAEELVWKKGFQKACIGVATNNPRARALYERLGYIDWGQGICEDSFVWIDEEGNPLHITEELIYLVKIVSP